MTVFYGQMSLITNTKSDKINITKQLSKRQSLALLAVMRLLPQHCLPKGSSFVLHLTTAYHYVLA